MTRRWMTMMLAALAVAASYTPTAQACGGFFCNAGTLSPIYQAGERVVFAQREEGGTTMHIEISYVGEPTDFGWILPLEAPRGPDGAILPLDSILQVSTKGLFDTVMQRTNPVFQVDNTFETHDCWEQRFDTTTSFDAANSPQDSWASDTGSTSEPPPVAVLQQANVGPYGAELIQATSGDALYEWLNENGYIQDPAARPLLEHYVGKDFIFLGLRLQTGKATGDIRPIQLNLGETFACVPLRLTSIAATPNMPMLVWVLGPHRAVPKNFLHAVVNPLAISWPGASNYVDVVSTAIDQLAGRAFVTEHATEAVAREYTGTFYGDMHQELEAQVREATTLLALVEATNMLGGVSDDELLSILQSTVPMPEGLTGYPHGNCYYDPSWSEPTGSGEDSWGWSGCEPDEEHLTTEAEFYTYLAYWLEELAVREIPLESDADALRAALLEGYFAPRQRIQAMFDESAWMTRFYTTISDTEMTRDPIFSFNPELGVVSRTHTLETVIRNNQSCGDNRTVATYETGDQVTFECEFERCTDLRTIPPVPGARALLRAEVLDEQGEPRAFDEEQADEVDAILDMANPGTASIPANFELRSPPEPEAPEELIVTNDGVTMSPSVDPAGCSCSLTRANRTPLPLSLALVFGFGALLALRRQSR